MGSQYLSWKAVPHLVPVLLTIQPTIMIAVLCLSIFFLCSMVEGACSPKGTILGETTSNNGCDWETPCCSSQGQCGYLAAWCSDGKDRPTPDRYKPKKCGERCYPGEECERRCPRCRADAGYPDGPK